MVVNSAQEYRNWFKEQSHRNDVNIDFMGCSHGEGDHYEKGFFNLFHGEKPNIERYLPSLLDIAEDNQAIYEFLQNAVDCEATHFWAFYNDQYFLAINNGSKFTIDGLSSILNIAQSTKSTASSIGRLGIGFKLAHRLVGKGNGCDELVNGNKGPIMFSWDNASQLQSLMTDEEIQCEGLSENPFLLKIAITNFPANVGEVAKDINYKDIVVFPESELDEMRSYVKESLEDLYCECPEQFKQGTLFFIKLGENKRELLDNDLDALKNGTEYSMNTLKCLNSICFNGESILKKPLEIRENSIDHTSELFKEIDPQYKEYDIQFSFGYLPLDFNDDNYYNAVEQLRQSPNFYKYFPMGDEVDDMALFIHCDSFQIESNRRKLINHHTNTKLLPQIAAFIERVLDEYRTTDRAKFLQLYAALLLTDTPSSKEKEWMKEVFFDRLNNSIRKYIPTSKGFQIDDSKVKIKDVKIDIPLDKIGLSDYDWFAWHGDNNEKIIDEGYNGDKLNLYKWDINDVIYNADLDSLNAWLDECSEEMFDAFINELKFTTPYRDVRNILNDIKLFKFGSERKSFNEIQGDPRYVITTEDTQDIKSILEKVGMICTNDPFESHPLYSVLTSQDEDVLYENIKKALEDNCKKLVASEKLSVVTTLSNFYGVGEVRLKQLHIFENLNGGYSSLGKLLKYRRNAEPWVREYVICKKEDFEELHKYMISSETMFNDILIENCSDVVNNGTTPDKLYEYYRKNSLTWDSRLTLKLLDVLGAKEEVLDVLEKTLDKSTISQFIKKMQPLVLSSDNEYAPDSFEYRCIQLAAKVDEQELRDKITVDGISLPRFITYDTLKLNFDNNTQSFCLKLGDILPDDTQSVIFGKICSKFSNIKHYDRIFKSNDTFESKDVMVRLSKILNSNNSQLSFAQYAYIIWYYDFNKQVSTKFGILNRLNLVDSVKFLDYCYNLKIIPILSRFKICSPWKEYFNDKYLFSSKYTREIERGNEEIEKWCSDDEGKREALKQMGVNFDDCAEIQRRKSFLNNTLTPAQANFNSFPGQFVHWVHSIAPITDDRQIEFLHEISAKFNNYYLKIERRIEDFESAHELDTARYRRWYSPEKIRIFTMESELPYAITYNKTDVICQGFKGNFYYFPDERRLYIKGNSEEEIASSLTHVYESVNSNIFQYQDFVSICFNSIEEQRERDDLYRKHKQEVEEKELQKEEKKRRISKRVF